MVGQRQRVDGGRRPRARTGPFARPRLRRGWRRPVVRTRGVGRGGRRHLADGRAARHRGGGRRGGDRARFVVGDLTTWQPDGQVDLVTASFLQSPVELSRGEILRRFASYLAPGGWLVVVAHAAPPPWMTAEHAGHREFPTPASEVAEIGLDGESWTVEVAEVRRRAAVGPDGTHAELDDSVVVLRRG